MLERVWRKGNPPTLLVGMQTSTATMPDEHKDTSGKEVQTAKVSTGNEQIRKRWGPF